MLIMRLLPTGRKHKKLYRIVVAEKHRHVSKKYLEKVGWYNPHTKDIHLDLERVKYYVGLNIELSDTVASLLRKQSVIA